MSNDVRPLTTLERSHARTVRRGITLVNALAMALGITSLLLGLAAPVAFIADGKLFAPPVMLLIALLTLFLVSSGALLIAYARYHEITLANTAIPLRGTITRERRRKVNAVTGGRHTLRIDFIDDIQLRWPYGADPIFDPLEGQYVELMVAMIEIRHRGPWTRLRDFLGCAKARPRKVAVVLEYGKAIQVHAALEKYGRHYLLRYHATMNTVVGALVALSLFILMQPATTDFLIHINFFLSLLAVLGYLAGLLLITLLVGKVIRALRRRFDPGFDETPHEERLKG